MRCLPKLPGILLLLFSSVLFSTNPPAYPSPGQSRSNSLIVFAENGYTLYGNWRAWGDIRPSRWEPGLPLIMDVNLFVTDDYLTRIAQEQKITADGLCLLVTAERTFDAEGHFRQANDERTSTLITPTGLAIEGGVQGAVTNRYGYDWRTPVDQFLTVKLEQATPTGGGRQVRFAVNTTLPSDLPPGIYRVRLDLGITSKTRTLNLNCETFAARGFPKGQPIESHLYSAPIPASGKNVAGVFVDASLLRPRVPWVLLGDYNSNGYKGAVAAEDRPVFAFSNRNLIPDEIILPMVDDNGNRISYSLEPQFPTDVIEARSNIPWNYASGEVSIVVTNPDGSVSDFGKNPFVGQKGSWPTTGKSTITAWKPPSYGYYTAACSGWIEDVWGHKYYGGGTYHFWIAKRMTLATATFQGMAYPTGGRYGRDMQFNPAVPADVEVSAVLYVNSDPANPVSVSYKGKASSGGLFGSAQGMVSLPLSSPGEYAAQVLAQYKDPDGHLWVCSMRHAGVVYPTDSTVAAHGKKLSVNGKYVDRGETHLEGYTIPGTDETFLQHINFPYVSGDVLLIASEQQTSNKIEPVLTYEDKTKTEAYDTKLATLGASNLKIKTSNGYSPHLYPEYITEWMYYYGAAPRPGFMSRFLVGENGVRAPYWPTSPNSFGGQIGASNNGDLPGDIYRLIGGVVVRKPGQTPQYAGYISSAFLLPKGTNNNRIIAAGAEDVIGSTGRTARYFLVGLRPGSVYEPGWSFAPAVQIDPILPVSLKFTLQFPDGRTTVWEGTGDIYGSWAGATRTTLDIPGIYKYWLEGNWNGFAGYMPGLPATGGEFYVVDVANRPAGAAGIRLSIANQAAFDASKPLTISGTSTAPLVYYAVIIPGSVLEQGTIAPKSGKFEYKFDPVALNQKSPTYDIVNLISGKPELGRVVHLTFFSREVAANGAGYWSFTRLLLRGNKIYYAR